jgi:ribonucrease Y
MTATIFTGLIFLILGIGLTLLGQKIILKQKRRRAESILEDAEKRAQVLIQEAEERKSLILQELNKKEELLNEREKILNDREKTLLKFKEDLDKEKENLEKLKKNLEAKKLELEEELTKISELSKEEARDLLFEYLEKEHQEEILYQVTKLAKERKEEIEEKTREMILSVLPKYARSVVSDFTTTVVSLPSEDLKGRIIGKEGRNIKHFENLTGVEVIIDETPEIVTLSSFDPVKREIARIAMEKLVQDGRINAATIEEKVKEAKEILDREINEAGRAAAHELNILDLPPQILHLMGRLKLRYSYGQNVLQHSIEVATFARMIAEELGLDSELAKKAGFLHDIGKAVSHEIEGSHLEIGMKILEKYGVDEKVILAMRSHHETYPFAIPEAYVVLAADILSAGRPGARREMTEAYIKRVRELEEIASSFKGVEKAFAISGARELRVFVKAEEVDDLGLYKLAKEIAQKISQEMRFPGEIKVVAIRESRAVEYAR